MPSWLNGQTVNRYHRVVVGTWLVKCTNCAFDMDGEYPRKRECDHDPHVDEINGSITNISWHHPTLINCQETSAAVSHCAAGYMGNRLSEVALQLINATWRGNVVSCCLSLISIIDESITISYIAAWRMQEVIRHRNNIDDQLLTTVSTTRHIYSKGKTMFSCRKRSE